jgi:two-component system sensor histidine kinase/response regulator
MRTHADAPWRRMVDALPQIVWKATPEGLADYFNAHTLQFTGLPGSALVGWGWLSAVHPDERPDVRRELVARIREQRPYQAECRMRRHDAVYRWVSCSHLPVHDEEGRVVQWVGACVDITVRKELEERARKPAEPSELPTRLPPRIELENELQKAKDRLELGLRSSNLSVIEIDMPEGTLEGGRLTTVNFWEPLGYGGGTDSYDVASMMGILPPDDRARVRDALQSYLRSDIPHFEVEHRVLHKNGAVQWRLARFVAIRKKDGTPLRLIGSHVDITERKALEERLQKAMDRLELSIRASNLSLFDWEMPDGNIDNAKQTFINVWEVLGHDPASASSAFVLTPAPDVHPDDVARVEGEVAEYLGGVTSTFSCEYRVRPNDGGIIWRLARGVARRDNAGRPVRFMGTMVDVTALKRVEEELLHAREVAESANKAKDEFLANVSHEIRTPMNAILGLTELALDSAHDARQRQMLATAKSATRSLLGIINDLLDFSRIAAGKVALDLAEFSLRDMLEDTVRALAVPATRKGIELNSSVHRDVPDVVVGDAGRMRQVLMNLVDNGIKFTQRGEVSVEVALGAASPMGEPAFLTFKVRDTGIGIAPERQAAIFRAFEQEEASTTRRYGGTGLGLTISAQLATLMGGQITVESEPGRGATFCFSVGLSRAPERVMADRSSASALGAGSARSGDGATEAAAARNTRSPAGPALRVLVAEDNELNIVLVTELLRQRGHLARVVGDGRAALALAAEGTFDVLLLDLHMPDMDGFEVARAIRHRELGTGRHLPIIALTARSSARDRERALAAGTDDFLPKPIPIDALFTAIDRALGAHPQ